MENEKLIPLTTDQLLALLATSELVFTAAPEGTVPPTAEIRFPVPQGGCF